MTNPGCHSFCLFLIFYNIHTFIQSHLYITFSVAIRRGHSSSLHRLYARWEKPPCCVEPRIELWPAFQQADVLPTEPRRTKPKLEPQQIIQVQAFHIAFKYEDVSFH